jgi:hypothetical protein
MMVGFQKSFEKIYAKFLLLRDGGLQYSVCVKYGLVTRFHW